jgi:hypothetical protein
MAVANPATLTQDGYRLSDMVVTVSPMRYQGLGLGAAILGSSMGR